jgi:rRNA-processing protein FCF1
LEESAAKATVVVDTNALLVPYGTGRESLTAIRNTYKELVAANRLAIPAQVAREFAEHRPEKLKTLYQQLLRKRNASLPEHSSYPLLESLPTYELLKRTEKELFDKRKEYRDMVEC